ncbi:MAG: tyrosine-type recombinase/integrase [Alphaproteobacteria bacterium]|jgi:integrase|nr:tyrosine-type recombinase/integrase [Alphaproteobacteria bacterium]
MSNIAPNSKFSFTKKALDDLPCPPQGKRYSFKDEKERGLIIRVTANGQKTFQLYQKHLGRPVRITLGTFPDMSIENARKEALKAKGSLAGGVNPNIEKNKLRQEITLKELFQLYMDRYSKIEKKSWKYDEREINKFLSHWFNRKISDISKHEITNLHLKLRETNGLYQANRILERVRALYNKAIEWGWDGNNPTKGIKKFKEKSRDRYISPAEMPLFIKALEMEENETAKDYFYIALFTGARKTNTLMMRWEQIDWHNRTWRIPDTKNGEPVIIPLTKQAEAILDRRLKAAHGNPWVFPSDSSKEGYFSDPKKAWNRVRQRATMELWKQMPDVAQLIAETEEKLGKADNYGFTVLKLFDTVQKEAEKKNINLPTGLMDIRLHDIRRTFGSYQAISGASLQIIGKSLGHKSQQSTQVYARLHSDPVKASMDKATDAMLAFATGEKK